MHLILRDSDCYVDRVAREVSYNQHVNVVTSQRFAENGLSDLVFILKCAALSNEVT